MRQPTSARIDPEEFFSILDAFADEKSSKEDLAFEADLDNWVNKIPELDLERDSRMQANERDSRMQAKEKILKCMKSGSKTLVLKELNLTSLPSGIWGQLTQLEVLSLRDNKLSQIPDDMGNLKKLLFLGLRTCSKSFNNQPHKSQLNHSEGSGEFSLTILPESSALL
jgi:Leucine-rich repeat (LRR) protein